MIPDEVEDPTINFSWFYFIGTAKFRLTLKETGRLTLTRFNQLYAAYKSAFDLEMRLWQTNTTYEEAYRKQQRAEEWF